MLNQIQYIRNSLRTLQWQVWLSSWHFDYSHYQDNDYPKVYHNWLFIGPFQFRWYS